ncbi:GlxA family transcriptional regulator [Roseibium sp. RKSG952]|uniref:GlxA family transcriptional regulator n=1 Tax=Roseibium sp. RKSG952 TaxID=2529384 RepID=UPI0012BBD103|nr:helix-turn-helix domain-containing protein [Roseibium sp. RKSG952]MTI02808.1 helix-turn-helix domain-containing protein [Roseibium sp. RKSG952]
MTDQSRIAIVRYRGALTSAVHGIEEMLSFAGGLERYRSLRVTITDTVVPGYDAYILPPAGQEVDVSAQPDIPKFLKQEHTRGALVCSVCVGLVWLAEAGVIGNRPVTTHWGLEALMAERYPDAATDVDQILIEHSDLATAGGMMAWVDLSMALIERFVGRDAMIETSRRFVVDVGRMDQRRYRSFTPDLSHQDAAIRKAQLAIESGYASRLSVDDLAQQAGLAERTFIRRFTSATGMTPMTYVQAIRIEKAKDQLIHSTKQIQQIAFDTGYADHSAFGRKFHQATGMTPKDFRRKFSA